MFRHPNQPTIGLALGGGIRGLAHIGVLRVLENEGIAVDLLAGSSMGAVVGAGYAAGLCVDYLEQEALRMASRRNWIGLVDRSLPTTPLGLLEGTRAERYFAERLGHRDFSDLAIPLAVVAADLDTGEEVIIDSGPVASALRASTSLPGIFAPARFNGSLLVDGAVLNPVPADVVRRMGAEIVIAVDVGTYIDGPVPDTASLSLKRAPLVVHSLLRIVGLMQMRITDHKLACDTPDILLRPKLSSGINLLNGLSRTAECVAAGEEATKAAMPALVQILREHRHQQTHGVEVETRGQRIS